MRGAATALIVRGAAGEEGSAIRMCTRSCAVANAITVNIAVAGEVGDQRFGVKQFAAVVLAVLFPLQGADDPIIHADIKITQYDDRCLQPQAGDHFDINVEQQRQCAKIGDVLEKLALARVVESFGHEFCNWDADNIDIVTLELSRPARIIDQRATGHHCRKILSVCTYCFTMRRCLPALGSG